MTTKKKAAKKKTTKKTTKKNSSNDQGNEPMGPCLRVKTSGKRPSFWRAGMQFTQEPVDLPLKHLSDEQIEAIKGEPLLEVTELDL